MSRLVLVLEGHFERAFDGGGAVVGEVEFRQAARHDFGELLAEPYRGLVREVREYYMFEAVEHISRINFAFKISFIFR